MRTVDAMERRIMGLETEYGIDIAGARIEPTSYWTIANLCAGAAPGPRLGGFHANGGRLYGDCGHVEWCTAECVNPLDVVASDRAGERLVARLSGHAAEQLAARGITSVTQFKHSVDQHGNVFGCHENYLVDADTSDSAVVGWLGGYLATRGVWAGAGRVAKGGRYLITQRGGKLESVTGSSTVRNRPLIHRRDEPLADPGRFRRLHIISGDANVSEVITWLKLACTDVLLRVAEETDRPPVNWRPRLLPEALSAIDADLTGHGTYRRVDGAVVAALDAQRYYQQVCEAHLAHAGGTDDQHAAIRRWGELLAALDDDGAAGVVGVCDWATKLDLCERLAARDGDGMAGVKVTALDLTYAEAERGWGRRLEAAGRLERVIDDAAVRVAVDAAPANTRAAVRGAFISMVAGCADITAVASWDSLWAGNRSDAELGSNAGIARYRLDDPFNTDFDRVRVWLDRAVGDELAAGLYAQAPSVTEPGSPTEVPNRRQTTATSSLTS